MVVLSFLIVFMIVQGALQQWRARAYSSEHFPLYWIMSGNFFVVEFSSDGCSVCWHFRNMVFSRGGQYYQYIGISQYKMKQYAYHNTPFICNILQYKIFYFLFIFFPQDFITIKTIVRNTCSFAYNYAIHGLLICHWRRT